MVTRGMSLISEAERKNIERKQVHDHRTQQRWNFFDSSVKQNDSASLSYPDKFRANASPMRENAQDGTEFP